MSVRRPRGARFRALPTVEGDTKDTPWSWQIASHACIISAKEEKRRAKNLNDLPPCFEFLLLFHQLPTSGGRSRSTMSSNKNATTSTTWNESSSLSSSYSSCIKGKNSVPRPRGCDTFVAFPPATAPGVVVFGKNSDRPAREGQSIRRYPRTENNTNASCTNDPSQPAHLLQCTYIQIPQVPTTNAVLLSQIDWMWGAEMGANEHGVVIGNEAVWTREPCGPEEPKALLGMDLVRLGLERGNTAREALDIITTLLEEHGQGGPCAQDDPGFTYHNSYLIVDQQEAWVLETAGRQWVAEHVTSGIRNISNCLSIRTSYDLSSRGIMEYAQQKGYWKPSSSTTTNGDQVEPFDFTKAFCSGSLAEEIGDPRFCGGRSLLEHAADGGGGVNKDSMIAILRDHSHGICMHGGFETTSSPWVSEIYTTSMDNTSITRTTATAARHWVTGKSHPCKNPFEEEQVVVAAKCTAVAALKKASH